MTTIRDIISVPALADITVVAGDGGLDREVRTVTVLDAPDGPKWLKGRELILSSTYLFERDQALLSDYVEDLIAMGASGFGLKMGRFLDHVSPDVITRADRCGFPILSIPRRLVWTDIISVFYKHYYGFMRRERRRVTIDEGVMSSLGEAVWWGARTFMAAMTKIFGIPIVLIENGGVVTGNGIGGVDRVMAILESAALVPEGGGDEVMELGDLSVMTCRVPSRSGGAPHYMAIGSPDRRVLKDLRAMFGKLATAAGQRYKWESGAADVTARFLALVGSGRVTEEEVAAFKTARDFDESASVGIMMIDGGDDAAYEQIRDALRLADGRRASPRQSVIFSQPDGRAIILLEHRSDPPCAVSGWIRGVMSGMDDRPLESSGARVSASNMYADVGSVNRCYHEAGEAMRIGTALWPGSRKYVYADVAPYATLSGANLSQEDLGDIALLMEENGALSFDGVRTMEAFMECDSYKTAARALFIHENTLRYRVQKINELLNLDMKDPITRFNFLLKLKLWKLHDCPPK
jgi:purine catabolism regulator